jgi:hypothetical protein
MSVAYTILSGTHWRVAAAPLFSGGMCGGGASFQATGSLRRTAFGPGGLVAARYDTMDPATTLRGVVLVGATVVFPLTTNADDDNPTWAPASFTPPPL